MNVRKRKAGLSALVIVISGLVMFLIKGNEIDKVFYSVLSKDYQHDIAVVISDNTNDMTLQLKYYNQYSNDSMIYQRFLGEKQNSLVAKGDTLNIKYYSRGTEYLRILELDDRYSYSLIIPLLFIITIYFFGLVFSVYRFFKF